MMTAVLAKKAAALLIIALLLLVGSATSSAAAPLAQPTVYQNPVINQDFPDPDILHDGDTYYAYATNSGTTNIQEAQSTDMIHWQIGKDALPHLPRWAIQQFGYSWAPDVSKTQGGYVMYFVARFRSVSGEKQCIGTATSDTPTGPFQPRDDQPLICQVDLGGSIDPGSFVDSDGARYVVWKNDGNSMGADTWLFIQRVSDNGLALQGEPIKLIEQDQYWEGNLIEAPTLVKHNGRYYLFYSANDYAGVKYAVGYASADAVLGPYVKPAAKPSKPLLATDAKSHMIGPGGEDVITDGVGNSWIVFHTWNKSVSYRQMNIAPLLWQDDVPVVMLSAAPRPAPEFGGVRLPF